MVEEVMVAGSPVIRTPDQRVRVFVSSTLRELAQERLAAIEAIRGLRLTPVLFELGARPHPPRRLYRAYLDQSHVFVGIYGEEYGWIAPGMEFSGLEDEYLLSGERPKLLYVKEPASARDDRLKALLQRIEKHDCACYKTFSSPQELQAMLTDDLAVLLSERFATAGAAPAIQPASQDDASGSPSAGGWRLGIGFALAVAAVVALGVGLSYRARQPKADSQEAGPAAVETAPESASIAVLPFVNMSPDPDQEYFSDGLSEELLNVLSNVPQLRVISRTSSFQFKGKSEDIRAIGRKLNVANVLEGSVRKSGRRIRITAQLVDAATGSHFWSETYDRDFDDIFAIQDDIARSVANASKVTLLGTEGRPSPSYGSNTEAYNLFLQAKYFTRRGTQEGLKKASEYYEQALKLDPGRAAYWAGLAGVHTRQVNHGFSPKDEGVRQSRAEVTKALLLDPNMAEAHALLAYIRLTHDWDWEGAGASMKKALENGPGSAMVVGNAAFLAIALGRFDEAIELFHRAIRLDPLNVAPHYNLSQTASDIGRLDEAEAALRKVLELNPDQPGSHAALGRLFLLRERPEAALDEMQKETLASERRQGLALTYFALGRKNEADSALAELVQNDGDGAAVRIAEVYAFRGDPGKAFEWLERAYAGHDPDLALIKGYALLRNLQGDPRYRAFLRKMRLPV